MRGALTPEVQEIAKKHIGREITLRELRLIPYIHYLSTNSSRIEISKVNGEERQIFFGWKRAGWVSGGASERIQVTHPFWEFMCEILFEAYVRQDEGELEICNM